MAEIVERGDALEEALMKLAYAQFNTEMELQKLSKEMGAFKDEMKDFKEENRRWGELANKMGILLFGSRARQTHRPDSDADVAMLLRGPHQRFLPTKLAMADVAFDVLLETGVNISPFPVWLDEWEHPEAYSNPHLLTHIATEGIRL